LITLFIWDEIDFSPYFERKNEHDDVPKSGYIRRAIENYLGAKKRNYKKNQH